MLARKNLYQPANCILPKRMGNEPNSMQLHCMYIYIPISGICITVCTNLIQITLRVVLIAYLYKQTPYLRFWLVIVLKICKDYLESLILKFFAFYVTFHDVFLICKYFLTFLFSKFSFSNHIRISNSLDPNQARHYVVPESGSKLFAKLISR